MDKNSLEYMFVKQVLGDKGVEIFKNTTFLCNPGKKSGSFDIGDGLIFLSSEIFSNPMSTDRGRELLIHELFHQIQYSSDPKAFEKLFVEFNLNINVAKFGLNPTTEYIDHTGGMIIIPDYSTKQEYYTYQYNLSEITELSDLNFLEAQAQLVGDFAKYYYSERYSDGIPIWKKNDMKKMAQILKNSGYDTEAVQWVLENYQ